jgi:hypothetical protein
MNQSAPGNRSVEWPALLMGLLLATGAASMLLLAALLAILRLTALPNSNNAEALSMLLLAAGTFFLGLLLLPGIYFNARKFFGATELSLHPPKLNDWIFVPALVITWLMLLLLGQLTTGHTLLAAWILPVANIFAISLPILLYLRISLRGLGVPSARRSWSIFGASFLIVPGLALFFEAIAVGVIVLLLFLYASTVPGLNETFGLLVENVSAGTVSETELTRLTASLLYAPGASVAMLAAFSLAIPLIEETFKLTVLWFYLGRIRRSVDGFVLGILCGAAFALAENIGFTSAGAGDWLASIVARATSALPHIFNSGLLGWALVSAWKEHRYLRLAAAFFAVVLLHGTWNAISLGLAMSGLSTYVAEVPVIFQNDFAWLAGWGMLAVGALIGLVYNNRQIRKLALNEAPEKVGYNLPLPGGDAPLETQISGENNGTFNNPD